MQRFHSKIPRANGEVQRSLLSNEYRLRQSQLLQRVVRFGTTTVSLHRSNSQFKDDDEQDQRARVEHLQVCGTSKGAEAEIRTALDVFRSRVDIWTDVVHSVPVGCEEEAARVRWLAGVAVDVAQVSPQYQPRPPPGGDRHDQGSQARL